jgi:hypothetical protein
MLIGVHHFSCIYSVGYCYVLIEVSDIIFGGEILILGSFKSFVMDLVSFRMYANFANFLPYGLCGILN